MLILIAILAAGWAATIVLDYFRIRGLRESNDYLANDRDDLVQQIIDAEKAAAQAEAHKEYAQLTLAGVLQRPSFVQLSEQNIQELGAIINSMRPGMEN